MVTTNTISGPTGSAGSGSCPRANRCLSFKLKGSAGKRLFVFLAVLGASSVGTSAADSFWEGPAGREGDWFQAGNWAGGVPGSATLQTTIDNGGIAAISGNDTLVPGAGANAGTILSVDNSSSVIVRAGSLTVVNLELGQTGTGTFNQAAGTTQADFLALGNLAGSNGVLGLTGGVLNATTAFVGFAGNGSFDQTGGTHNVTTSLVIGQGGAQGIYNLSGGSLNAGTEVVGNGGASVGVFNQTAGTHTVSGTLAIGDNTAQGTYNLSGGLLTAAEEFVGREGGRGTVSQSDGTHTVTGTLHIGASAGGADATGSYLMTGGALNAANEIVADGRPGSFTQTGGAHTVSNLLQIGFGERGTYELSGSGTLTAANETIGNFGTGIFTQAGGTHRVGGTLNIGQGSGIDPIAWGRGTYSLSDGSLTVNDETIGLFDPGQGSTDVAQGLFLQTGGNHAVLGTLRIGGANGVLGIGAYNLGGGNLNVANEIISDGGTGTFTQTGGNHVVGGTLTIGETGSYALSNGGLTASSLINNGSFSQAGGSVAADRFINNQGFSYTGGTFVGSFINNGTADFNPNGQAVFAANISGSGKLTKTGDATLVLTGNNTYNGGTTVTSGVLQGNTGSLQGNITNNASLVFDQAATGTYSGTISGGGNVVKQNAGLLIFNGNSTYTGGTQILGGALQIGDASHPGASIPGLVNVGANGTLSGHGTVNGSVVNAGTIAPGGSIGTLTVNGNATFQSGSRLQTAINPEQASVLNVAGLASLNAGLVDVQAENGAYGPRRYTILSAGAISGRFLDEVTSNFASIDPLLTPSLAYDANRVYLDLNPLPVMENPVGAAEQVATNTVYMIDRLVAGRFSAPLGEQCSSPTLGFWGRGIGMLSSAPASGVNAGYDGGTSGFVLGVDGQPTDRLSVGIVGFSAHSDVTTNALFTNRSTVNMAGFNLYGAYTHGAWQVRSALGYSNESYFSQQLITTRSQQRVAVAATEANRLSNYTEGSYTFKTGIVSLQPLLAMQFGWMDQDGFTQKGLYADGQGLQVAGRTQYVLDTLAGARARQDFTITQSMKVQFELRALYLHQFGTLQNYIAGNVGTQSVSLGTQDRPGERDAGILGAGLTLLAADSVNVYMDYNAQILSSQTSSFFSAGVRYAW